MTEDFRRLFRPLSPGSLAELRGWARAWMASRHSRVDASDVLLAMTELVVNSVKHGHGPVDVELSTTDEKVLVQVSDGSDDLPGQRKSSHMTAEGGRGVLLIERLAFRWGVLLNSGGGKPSGASSHPGRERGSALRLALARQSKTCTKCLGLATSRRRSGGWRSGALERASA